MDKLSASKAQYNNCFVLGGKAGPLRGLYALTYEQARRTLNTYLNGTKRVKGDESLRVSLYLDNAMYGDLHVFVIDFDSFDENSGFFQRAKSLADKVTRSQERGTVPRSPLFCAGVQVSVQLPPGIHFFSFHMCNSNKLHPY